MKSKSYEAAELLMSGHTKRPDHISPAVWSDMRRRVARDEAHLAKEAGLVANSERDAQILNAFACGTRPQDILAERSDLNRPEIMILWRVWSQHRRRDDRPQEDSPHDAPDSLFGPVIAALQAIPWEDEATRKRLMEEFSALWDSWDVPKHIKETFGNWTIPAYLFQFRKDDAAGIPWELTQHVTFRGQTRP